MPTRKELEQHYQAYDKRETAKNRAVRPVRDPSNASRAKLIERANMAQKLALNIINNKVALINPKGLPTTSAMQFKRWGYAIPKTVMAVRQILKQSRNYLRTINEET